MPLYSITLLGYPLPLLFLYFLWYSLLGWLMETTYCSIKEKLFVFRGFLMGPICPIYGFGALMMVLWLSRFSYNIFLFYIVATITMSAWEYLVAWLLEVTTHIKYWDYSNHKFNLKGRICLSTCLYWGVAAYVAIYWIHPASVRLFQYLTPFWQTLLAVVLLVVTLADTIGTIRRLALTSEFLQKAERVRKELEIQRDLLYEVGLQKLQTVRLQIALAKLELERSRFLQEAAHHSARFRHRYAVLSSRKFAPSLQVVKEQAARLLGDRAARFAQQKKLRKDAKKKS